MSSPHTDSTAVRNERNSVEEPPVPAGITVTNALNAAIGIFTGSLRPYPGDPVESVAARAGRSTPLAKCHPAAIPEGARNR